ncbi:efflux RND transporter permease subunit [Pseudidiomarina sediminum]|uniref:efflux RND transporter permease subunit n=1 Tax=Pseudidiomarina sediminum TaxID=431675 RepID=UPI001C948CAA|nr:CusA/CzcA family heavy metal efflux RND transporter [Pseudidiomarina sediminum]MBY6062727.1 CusA/CzcA family heavy metal efflux RND transporter [Pseudidiomarina sediminum]
MIKQIITFSLKHRLFVFISFLLLIGAGVQSLRELPVDAFPEISPTQVNLTLRAPGMSAERVERQVTHPIETELLGIPKQTILRSTTKYGIASITLDFVDGTDIYWARQQVAEKLAAVRDSLPAGTQGGLAPMSTPLSEMFMFSVENPHLSLTEKRHLLDWLIRPALRTVAGVADVTNLGGKVRTFQFTPDMAHLSSAKLTLTDLEQALHDANQMGNLGRLTVGTEAFSARVSGQITSLADLAAIPVSNSAGQVYRIEQLGQVQLSYLPRFGAITKDGEEAVEGLVVGLRGANAAAVVAAVTDKIAQLQPSLPAGTEINVFYNRKGLIDTAIEAISSALVQSIVLVVAVLIFFLRNVRASLLVSLAIPIAALITFICLRLLGISANLMSLGGLVIAIGMIVDAAVVITEKIETELNSAKQLPLLHKIYRASVSVAPSVVSGTVIIILVFLPLLSLTGLEGKLFSPVALTIVIAITAALVTALTLVPALASMLMRPNQRPNTMLERMQRGYRSLLERAMKQKKTVMIGFASVAALSVVSFLLVGKTFMPTMDEGDIIVQLEKSPSISLQESIAIDAQIEKDLLSTLPEIKQIVARTGSDELGLDPMGLNETDVFMELQPQESWRFETKQELIQAIREVIANYPGINVNVTQPIQMRISEMLTGSSGAVSIKVFGDDMETLAQLTDTIVAQTSAIDGAVDVQASVITGARFVSIVPDLQKLQHYGISKTELSQFLHAQLTGYSVSEAIDGRIRTPIVFGAQHPEGTYHAVENLQRQTILGADGKAVPLSALATIHYDHGAAIIERENANRYALITTNVENRDVVGFVEALKVQIATSLTLPSGYYVEYGGEFENQARASANLLMVIPVALLLIVILLFTSMGSMPLTTIVLTNIPFALSGGAISLWLSGEYMSVPASVGFIALMGVAILNGIVMVSHFEQSKVHFATTEQLVLQGATDRLRPVLITAVTAIFGLVPLLIASGPGSEIQKPLAIVVIGGLITATLATLVLLPLLYLLTQRRTAHGN